MPRRATPPAPAPAPPSRTPLALPPPPARIDGVLLSSLPATPTRMPTSVSKRKSGKSNGNSNSDGGRGERPNLWTILKEALGTDITRITLPVYFNEPVSFLQRLAEDVEYSALLDRAADGALAGTPDRIALVAAFVASHYSATAARPSKPFNPLLRETFELVRPGATSSTDDDATVANAAVFVATDATDDATEPAGPLALLAEQVSHHPPVSALHAVGRGWTYDTAHRVRSKFHPNSLEVWPEGAVHIRFHDGDHYVYDQAHTYVNNVILGDLSIDNAGTVTVRDAARGAFAAVLKLRRAAAGSPSSLLGFSGESKKRRGELSGKVVRLPSLTRRGSSGDAAVAAAAVAAAAPVEGEVVRRIEGNWNTHVSVDGRVVWRAAPRPPRAATAGYELTRWAWALNAPARADEAFAPARTDSRLRPDQRALEEGRYRDAAALKDALETAQRQRRDRAAAAAAAAGTTSNGASQPGTSDDGGTGDGGDDVMGPPRWFRLVDEPATGKREWRYSGGYFEQRAAGALGRRDDEAQGNGHGADARDEDIFAVDAKR